MESRGARHTSSDPLKQLRGETLGRIADLDRQLEVIKAQRSAEADALRDIAAVLKRQDPGVVLESIEARRCKGSLIGTRGDDRRVPIAQAVLNLLRVRDEPMTVNQIVGCLQLDYPDADARKLTANVRTLLSAKKIEGVLKATPTAGRSQAYSFANGSIKQPTLRHAV